MFDRIGMGFAPRAHRQFSVRTLDAFDAAAEVNSNA
jgi:hypothetical protein